MSRMRRTGEIYGPSWIDDPDGINPDGLAGAAVTGEFGTGSRFYREAPRLDPAKVHVIGDEPEIVVHVYRPGLFVAGALAIALGGSAALLGSSLATDWLAGHGYWPGFEIGGFEP